LLHLQSSSVNLQLHFYFFSYYVLWFAVNTCLSACDSDVNHFKWSDACFGATKEGKLFWTCVWGFVILCCLIPLIYWLLHTQIAADIYNFFITVFLWIYWRFAPQYKLSFCLWCDLYCIDLSNSLIVIFLYYLFVVFGVAAICCKRLKTLSL